MAALDKKEATSLLPRQERLSSPLPEPEGEVPRRWGCATRRRQERALLPLVVGWVCREERYGDRLGKESRDSFPDGPRDVPILGFAPMRLIVDVPATDASQRIGNDPSAGSPTETLLRLLLPLNATVWSSSRQPGRVIRQANSPRTSLKRSIGSSDGRCVQRAGT